MNVVSGRRSGPKAMNLLLMLVALAAAAFVGSTAQAVPILGLWNTGVDANGVPLGNDAIEIHYDLVSDPGSYADPYVFTSTGLFPIPPWLGDNQTSAWISPERRSVDPSPLEGQYVYELTFDLTGFDPSTAVITGKWSTDNEGDSILLNGNDTGNHIAYGTNGAYSFLDWTSFSVTTGFQAGLNTLHFVVNNGNGTNDLDGPTGLRVEFTSGTVAVPEPMSMLMLGALGSGMLAARKVRRRRA